MVGIKCKPFTIQLSTIQSINGVVKSGTEIKRAFLLFSSFFVAQSMLPTYRHELQSRHEDGQLHDKQKFRGVFQIYWGILIKMSFLLKMLFTK